MLDNRTTARLSRLLLLSSGSRFQHWRSSYQLAINAICTLVAIPSLLTSPVAVEAPAPPSPVAIAATAATSPIAYHPDLTTAPTVPATPAAAARAYLTTAEVEIAVSASPWGQLDVAGQARIVRIMQCEAPAYDESGAVIGVDPSLIGDQGRAYGPLQIRADFHPGLIARYNVFELGDALRAGWELFTAPGGGWSQWSCSWRT